MGGGPVPGAGGAPDLREENIQGNIVPGFLKDHQAFLFLSIGDPDKVGAWLDALRPQVASAAEVRGFNSAFSLIRRKGGREDLVKATWINVAFTHSGLRELGASQADLDAFPNDYKEGMAHRAGAIGDIEGSAPGSWPSPLGQDDVHILLMIAADDPADLGREVYRQLVAATSANLELVFLQEGNTRADDRGHEHFGFKDGISQPGLRGFTVPNPNDPNQGILGQDLIWPGEFIVGYPGQLPPPGPAPQPGQPGYNPNPAPAPPPDPHAEGPADVPSPVWTADGSYLVFRRLRQDVAGFRKFLSAAAPKEGLDEERLGSALVGRYRSGAPREPLKNPIAGTDPAAGDPSKVSATALDDDHINNFEYGADGLGAQVPRAAHIRKAYPRDQADPGEQETQTHRVLRRGIPYGLSYDPNATSGSETAGDSKYPLDRGLLFLCYQRSIERQFEFVQRFWVNSENFPKSPPTAGKDPIISQDSAQKSMALPGAQQDPLSDIPLFVTTTGGAYFFQPSIEALRKLAGT